MSTAQPIESASKPRRSRKAPGIKAAVIQQRLSNKSKRQISKDLGITRNTVTTILEESNVEQALKSFSQQSVELVPEALRVMRFRLQANSENAAIKTLESTIWPLQDKQPGRPANTQLFVAIQNLMQPSAEPKPAPITIENDAKTTESNT